MYFLGVCPGLEEKREAGRVELEEGRLEKGGPATVIRMRRPTGPQENGHAPVKSHVDGKADRCEALGRCDVGVGSGSDERADHLQHKGGRVNTKANGGAWSLREYGSMSAKLHG